MKIKPMNEKEFYKLVDELSKMDGISKEEFLDSAENNFYTPEDGQTAGFAKICQECHNWTDEFTIAFTKRLKMELIKIAKPWATDESIRIDALDFDKMYEKKIVG